MRILHITPCLAPAWAYGRVAQDVMALARAQAAAGHAVIVLTTDALAPHERLPAGDTLMDGVHIIRVRNISGAARAWLDVSSPVGMRKRARTIFRTCAIDIVHLHELRTAENWSVLAEAPLSTGVVLSPHGTAMSGGRGSAAARIWDRLVLDRMLARAARVVAASDDEAGAITQLFAERHVPLGDGVVTVVPGGVDTAGGRPGPSRDLARAHFGLDSGPVVLSTGRIDAHAQLVPLVAAFAAVVHRVPQAQWLVAGGDHGGLQEVRARVHDLGLDAHVRFAGYLGAEALTVGYAAADVLVLPRSGSDCVRETVVPALAAGVPALLGAPGDISAIDGDAVRTVESGAAAWTEAMLALVASPDDLARAQKRAGQIASGHSWSATANVLHANYEDALRREKIGRMSR